MKLGKSKLALAKVINENGGWPQDSEWAVQNGDHGRISFSINKPVRHDSKSWMAKGGFNFKIEVCKPLKNWHQCVLNREEYYQAYPKADADGWIEWKGGMKGPVEFGVPVDVKTKDGYVHYDQLLGDACWRDNCGDANIISYRLHKPEAKPEFCESVMRSIPDPESKPTIEQLAQDYRNKLYFAKRKQQEADDAKVAADAALGELELAGEALGLLIGIAKPEPELEITDWRDLQVGDEVECVESNIKRGTYNGMAGRLRTIDESDTSTPYLVDFGGKAKIWCHEVKFIRRP